MTDPWKRILCWSPECEKFVFDEDGNVNPGMYIRPDIDTEEITQFTCPRCGLVETWGMSRRRVAQVLYERFEDAGVGK